MLSNAKRDVGVGEMTSYLDTWAKKHDDWDNMSPEERMGTLKRAERQAIAEQVEDCTADFSYAARNYFYIANKRGEDQLFTLWESQALIFQKYCELRDKRPDRAVKLMILKARQVGACLDPNTRILTRDLRWMPIGDSKVGDELVAFDEDPASGKGHVRMMSPAVVEAKNYVYEPAFRVVLDNNQTFIATGDHRFLCKNRGTYVPIPYRASEASPRQATCYWKPVKKMRVGDKIRFIAGPWGSPTYEDGWFGGMLDGEGSLRGRKKAGGAEICMSQVENGALQRAEEYLKSRGYKYHRDVDQRSPGDTSKLGGKPVVKLVVNRVNEIFRLVGQTRPSRFVEQDWWEGMGFPGRSKGTGIAWPSIVSIEPLGKRQMVDLQTSTGTFVAEGFASHNSLLIEAMIAWRAMFFPNTGAIVLSVDSDHAKYLFGLMLHIYDMMPWWLKPQAATLKYDEGLTFDNPDRDARRFRPGLNSRITVQHANQVSGVGQGRQVSALHGSEYSDWLPAKAEEIIEGDILHAISDNNNSFAFLESTGRGAGTYSHNLWKTNVKLAERAEWYPLFIPWFFEMTRRDYSFPKNWKPMKQEHLLRNRVSDEWVRCDKCGTYQEAGGHGEDRRSAACESCEGGVYRTFVLEDAQLYWKQSRRENAEGKGKEAAKKHKAEMACVAGWSRVSTDRGIVRIDAAKGASTTETGAVSRWYDQGDRECLMVTTSMGRELVCTPEHRFHTPDREWIEASDLVPGQSISLSPPMHARSYYTATWQFTPTVSYHTLIDDDWGRFLGYWAGDGCWRGRGVNIACDIKDQDVVDDVCRVIEKIMGRQPIRKTRGNMTLIFSNDKRWMEILIGLGALEQWGGNQSGFKRKVCVPDCIWRSPRSVVMSFLQGLFESDGSSGSKTPRVVFSAKQDEFIKDVQLLLLSFGVNSVIAETHKNIANKSHKGHILRLNYQQAREFHRHVGFVGKRKRSTCVDRPLPYNAKTASKNLMVDYISSVSPAGVVRVYDLTVKGTHQFGANGMLVHNTTAEESWQNSGLQIFDDNVQEIVGYTLRDPNKVAGVLVGYIDVSRRFHARVAGGKCRIDSCKADHRFDEETFTVWTLPEPGREYCCGVDIAEGIGQDYSVIFVNRLGRGRGEPDEQVAMYRSNAVEPYDLAFYCDVIGRMYNDALMAIEYNTFRTTGDRVVYNYNYPNVFKWKHLDSTRPISNRYHWYTQYNTKPLLWQTVRKWLRASVFIVRDPGFLEEMKSFKKDEDDSKSANSERGGHDDILIAGSISLYCVAPEMKVLTSDLRWVPIGGCKVGDRLISFDEDIACEKRRSGSLLRDSEILSLHRREEMRYRIETDKGVVIASAHHGWVTLKDQARSAKIRRWSKTSDLSPGDEIIHFTRTWESDYSPDAQWLAGFLDGEGCVRLAHQNLSGKGRDVGRGDISFAQKEGVALDKALRVCGDLGIHTTIGGNGKENGCKVVRMRVDSERPTLEIVGRLRPVRLLQNAKKLWENRPFIGWHWQMPTAKVLSITPIGTGEVVSIGTTTKTLFVEGLASHNCAHETDSDAAGAISVPYQNEEQAPCLYRMWCETCGFGKEPNEDGRYPWGSNNPSAEGRCPDCRSIRLRAEHMESVEFPQVITDEIMAKLTAKADRSGDMRDPDSLPVEAYKDPTVINLDRDPFRNPTGRPANWDHL